MPMTMFLNVKKMHELEFQWYNRVATILMARSPSDEALTATKVISWADQVHLSHP